MYSIPNNVWNQIAIEQPLKTEWAKRMFNQPDQDTLNKSLGDEITKLQEQGIPDEVAEQFVMIFPLWAEREAILNFLDKYPMWYGGLLPLETDQALQVAHNERMPVKYDNILIDLFNKNLNTAPIPKPELTIEQKREKIKEVLTRAILKVKQRKMEREEDDNEEKQLVSLKIDTDENVSETNKIIDSFTINGIDKLEDIIKEIGERYGNIKPDFFQLIKDGYAHIMIESTNLGVTEFSIVKKKKRIDFLEPIVSNCVFLFDINYDILNLIANQKQLITSWARNVFSMKNQNELNLWIASEVIRLEELGYNQDVAEQFVKLFPLWAECDAINSFIRIFEVFKSKIFPIFTIEECIEIAHQNGMEKQYDNEFKSLMFDVFNRDAKGYEILANSDLITLNTKLKVNDIISNIEIHDGLGSSKTQYNIIEISNLEIVVQKVAIKNGFVLKPDKRERLTFLFNDLIKGEFKLLIDITNDRSHFPKTIDEASNRLIGVFSIEELLKVKNIPWEEYRIEAHMGTAVWLRNYFGLWRGNWDLILDSGIESMDPDDVSSMILHDFWNKIQVKEWLN